MLGVGIALRLHGIDRAAECAGAVVYRGNDGNFHIEINSVTQYLNQQRLVILGWKKSSLLILNRLSIGRSDIGRFLLAQM